MSTPLTYSNLEVSGNGAHMLGPTSSDVDFRGFTNRGGTDTWISFVYQRTGTLVNGYTGLAIGSGNASIAGGAFTGTSGLFLGQWGPVGSIVMGLNDVEGIGLSLGGGQSSGVPYFVVLELDYSGPTNGTMRGYLNPTPGTNSPGAANASITFTLQDLNLVGFETSISDGLRVDEIRIGDTYADVSPVPEPSTVAFLAAAAGLLALHGLRRKA